MLEGARGGGEGAVFGEGGVGACGLDGDVADDFDVFAECDVAVDGEGFAVEEGGCAIGEAGGEVGPEFVVAGIEFDGGRFAVAARVEEEACVVAQGIGIGPEGEEVVGRLDGRKRVRGISMTCAPGSMARALPMAVSSWRTGGELGSRGSTVLRLIITGRSGGAPVFCMKACSAARSSQRLLVLK